jgi:predicted nucleic acid-binding Zn ribbon protein
VKRRAEPVSLREALAGVGQELGIPNPAQLSALLDAWPALVGETLAGHCQVRSLRDGVLVVSVDSPAVATQVRYLEAAVREAADRLAGAGVFRRLQVVVQAPGKRL